MDMLDWAKREVEIACKKENPDRKEGEFDYGCACYESALKAFESLLNDNHSGYGIEVTKHILNRLIDGQPLTPIEDTDDVWERVNSFEANKRTYQCKRQSSLFKDIYDDGRVEYHDVDHSYCIDIHNTSCTYSNGLISKIIHEMFPITMPYIPIKPIKVYCEDFLVDEKNGDYDTMGILGAIREVDGVQEKSGLIDSSERQTEKKVRKGLGLKYLKRSMRTGKLDV